MSKKMDVSERYPDLFVGVSDEDTTAIVEACAINIHEGWDPSREAVALLIDRAQGKISFDEYVRATLERIGVSASCQAVANG